MFRSACLPLALSAVHLATAQLAPHVAATPSEHLLEVNAHWAMMDPSVLDEVHTVQFTSEAERIAMHLHRVHDHLSTHTPIGMEPAALAHRTALLYALNIYAERGLFPVNDAVPGRSPVFIDELGTACAVGHLMITSGHADIAERIRSEMNVAYVPDIAMPEVGAWADAHGFTIDELAWIQPTYNFPDFNERPILLTLQLLNGELIVVEGPAPAQTTRTMRVIQRTELGDKVIGTLPMLTAVDAVELEGHVFLGGTPLQAGNGTDVFEWTGKQWVKHDPFKTTEGILALDVRDGKLHARGMAWPDGKASEMKLAEGKAWKAVTPAQAAPGVGDTLHVVP